MADYLIDGCALKPVEKLGEGTFGVVHKLQKQGDQCARYAAKKFKNSSDTNGLELDLVREIATFAALGSSGIVRVVNVSVTHDYSYILMELHGVNLKRYLRCQKEYGISSKQNQQHIAPDIDGATYANKLNIMHRDVKPENILIDVKTNNIKVCDWGLSVAFVEGRNNTVEVQTLWYRCPEVLVGHTLYTTNIDTWSVGMIMYELLTGYP